jgi:hypothetical protein
MGASHVVYSSQYWIGQTIDKTANPWNLTWQDGTATNYGNWNIPSHRRSQGFTTEGANRDRGGGAELVNFVKNTFFP